MDVAETSKESQKETKKSKEHEPLFTTTVKTRLGPDSDASPAVRPPVTGDSRGVPVTGMAPRTRPPKLEGKA